jgi:hypothetical protein
VTCILAHCVSTAYMQTVTPYLWYDRTPVLIAVPLQLPYDTFTQVGWRCPLYQTLSLLTECQSGSHQPQCTIQQVQTDLTDGTWKAELANKPFRPPCARDECAGPESMNSGRSADVPLLVIAFTTVHVGRRRSGDATPGFAHLQRNGETVD